MKKSAIYLILISFTLLSGCGQDKTIEQRCIVKNLPEGITCYGFNEKFDKPYGKWTLDFFMKNTTGKTIEFPQVDADLYLDDKMSGPVTGGPGKALASGDSAVISYAWIFPNKVPDSLIFRFIEMK
jgi:hypothetical protein